MKKIVLPLIVEEAKKRPLSIDPKSEKFIYYNEVESGEKKIFPVEKLDNDHLLKLAIKRQLTNEPAITAVLNGQLYNNRQLAEEMKRQSKIGKQMFKADIDYLKFYLSSFPVDCFVR